MSGLPAGTLDRILRLSPEDRGILVRSLTMSQRREFDKRWAAWAQSGQLAPPGDWHVWLIRAGRGFGKTRAGAEWISQLARDNPNARIALVGGTIEDARRVMVEGVSGLVAVSRITEDMIWMPHKGELIFPSGARAFVYAATKPESLRGPEHDAAWCDELGKWGQGGKGGGGEAAWDNLLLGLRIGERPRVVVTTTPRATVLMRRVMAMPGLVETHGSTRDNRHLPDSYVAGMEALYGQSRLGRQELDGELIEDVAGALWTRKLIEARRAAELPPLVRVVVGVDPPAGSVTEGKRGDACGIVAVACGRDGRAYVIEDASVADASPAQWARAVAACAARVGADRVVAEANQGGRMVAEVLRAACATLPLRLVHASHGKTARAEPVAALYEGGRAWHLGAFPALEDELCGLVAGGGYEGPGRSPDRADALVWAMTHLMLMPEARAGVREL